MKTDWTDNHPPKSDGRLAALSNYSPIEVGVGMTQSLSVFTRISPELRLAAAPPRVFKCHRVEGAKMGRNHAPRTLDESGLTKELRRKNAGFRTHTRSGEPNGISGCGTREKLTKITKKSGKDARCHE